MALSRSTYSVPGTPRVYIDNLLYGRAVGMVFDQPTFNGVSTANATVDLSNGFDTKLFWDLDPSRYNTINFANFVDEDLSRIYSKLIYTGGGFEFKKLLGTSNYAAVFNHNLNTASEESLYFYLGAGTVEGAQNTVTSSSSIVGDFDEDVSSNGFIVAEVVLGDEEYDWFSFNIKPSGDGEFIGDANIAIGSFSVGTYLDFPNSPDLNVKQSISHDGVSTTRTLAGKDLTNIRYSGAPNWGDLPPFTNTKADTYNYKGTGFTGRKSWDMKFSYVDKTDMFNSIMSGSSAGTNFRILPIGESSYEDGFRADESIVGTYLSRTLGGSLKHVLQPDNTKDEFHFVKLDQNSTDIQQVAHGVFDISLKFIQVW